MNKPVLYSRSPWLYKHDWLTNVMWQVFDDAQKMLKEIVNGRKLQANGVAAFYPANSVGDDIVVYEDEERVRLLLHNSFIILSMTAYLTFFSRLFPWQIHGEPSMVKMCFAAAHVHLCACCATSNTAHIFTCTCFRLFCFEHTRTKPNPSCTVVYLSCMRSDTERCTVSTFPTLIFWRVLCRPRCWAHCAHWGSRRRGLTKMRTLPCRISSHQRAQESRLVVVPVTLSTTVETSASLFHAPPSLGFFASKSTWIQISCLLHWNQHSFVYMDDGLESALLQPCILMWAVPSRAMQTLKCAACAGLHRHVCGHCRPWHGQVACFLWGKDWWLRQNYGSGV